MSKSSFEYEYWAWDVEIPKGEEVATIPMYSDRMPRRQGYDELGARLYAWNHLQSEILPHIKKHLEPDGWEPISEVGPAALKITTYNQTGGLGRFLLQAADPQWAVVGWRIEFRRLKGTGQYPVDVFNKIFNKSDSVSSSNFEENMESIETTYQDDLNKDQHLDDQNDSVINLIGAGRFIFAGVFLLIIVLLFALTSMS